MSEKQGKVKIVSKYGGFQFEGEEDWYNGVKNLKEQIAEDRAKYLDKTVKLELDAKGKYTKVHVVPEGEAAATEPAPAAQNGNVNGTADNPHKTKEEAAAPLSKDDFWGNKERRDIENDKIRNANQAKIQRAGALNTALEAVTHASKYGASGMESGKDVADKNKADLIIKAAIALAETEILPWLNK